MSLENNSFVEPKWESLPGYLQELVNRDNKRLRQWITELIEMRKGNVQKGRDRHDEIVNIYSMLPAKKDLTYDFIETSWIKEWLDPQAKVTEIPQVNNKELLCSHGKVDPGKIHLAKRIKKEAADKIYSSYGGGPRITEKGLCEACVKARATLMRLQSCLQEDSKFIIQGLKSKVESGCGYWVGKQSLKCWKRLAQSQVEETEVNNTEVNGNTKSDDSNLQEDEMDSELVQFNEDIQCPHGSLTTDTSKRRIISSGVWRRLQKYFTSAPEFAETCHPCALCQRSDDQKAEEKDLNCAKAASLKEVLSNIYITRRRPSVGSRFYIFSCIFSFFLVWHSEWEILQENFPVNYTIRLFQTKDESVPRFQTQPGSQHDSLKSVTLYEFTRPDSKAPPIRKLTQDDVEAEALRDSRQDSDPDYTEQIIKKPKLAENLMNLDGQRRSSRHRRVRGEKEVIASSSNTLKELKIKV
ncbi:Ubiquitin carboxyl-terminal hydrolase 48 [Holothuria leucospilota]|uniref:Ubiquitin carboxyl-terminal hydrolase 48 n=1 Tax=Holothuria leucospilota TaxID=206669 RepID=A0A9Q0Y8H4_HOLLE|nr:Ubiquitin carboxyl-terminal hydrolase 48 [Holothuria leucospilota]